MHASTFLIAPGPPESALAEAHRRLAILSQTRIDYSSVGYEHAHAWRIEHADPEDPANLPGIEWCDRIPLPLPYTLLSAILVTPSPRMFWAPLGREENPAWPHWEKRLNNAVERGAREGSCLVIADVHV